MDLKHLYMIPIPIADFISGAMIPVDLYLRLSEDKFVLITKAGSNPNREQLMTYKNKTVEYLWIKKIDYGKFVHNNISIAGIVVNQENLTTAQKTQVLTQAAANVFTELDHMGLGFESYSHSKQIVEATVALAENHKDLSGLFATLSECSDHLLRHSMAVCAVSVLVAQVLKWENKQTIEKLALGALLHDVGLKTLPRELIDKPRSMMTYEENQLFETHSYRGMQLLITLGIVPDDVLAVVYEHHENSIGQGYPRKLRNLKIHPLARVVALADEFCNLTLKSPNCPVPKSPREAIMTIELTMGQPHNKEAFRALQMVINKEYADAS